MENKLALVQAEDLSFIDNNVLNDKQLAHILKATPKQYIKSRPAKGGGNWDYVTGGYVRKCLNLMFGWDWDFEILEDKILLEAKEVVVKGRLTCRVGERKIIKTQYGNKDIMFRKGSSSPLSVGNDLKAAATDCLKKCAAEIGIAADVYNKEDFKAVQVDVSTSEEVSDAKEYERIIDHLNKCNSIEEVEMLEESIVDIDNEFKPQIDKAINELKTKLK